MPTTQKPCGAPHSRNSHLGATHVTSNAKHVNTLFMVSTTDSHLVLRQFKEDGSFTKQNGFITAGSPFILELDATTIEYGLILKRPALLLTDWDSGWSISTALRTASHRLLHGFLRVLSRSVPIVELYSWNRNTGHINKLADIHRTPLKWKTLKDSSSKPTTQSTSSSEHDTLPPRSK